MVIKFRKKENEIKDSLENINDDNDPIKNDIDKIELFNMVLADAIFSKENQKNDSKNDEETVRIPEKNICERVLLVI